MPTYQRFKNLPVWQKAADLAAQIFEWTQQPVLRGKGDLANQLQRATLSISNNIAEGFERGSTNELIHFLYIARGSAGEVRSMLCVMQRMPAFNNLKSEISNLKSTCENISRQIRGWTDSLQNSEIKGQRHLNDETRGRYHRQKKQAEIEKQRKEFQQQMEERLKREAEQRGQDREQQ
jgi:four helix bundle protein